MTATQYSMKPEVLDTNFGETKQIALGTMPDGQYAVPDVIFKKSSIDALSNGTITLGTTDAGKLFFPESVTIAASAGTVFTTVGTLTLGTAGVNNDVLGTTAATGVTAIGKSIRTAVGTAALAGVAGGTVLNVVVANHATGTGIKYDVYLKGFYA